MIRNIIAWTFLVWACVGVTSADVTVAPAGAFSASGKLAMKKGAIPVSCHTTFNGQVSDQGDRGHLRRHESIVQKHQGTGAALAGPGG